MHRPSGRGASVLRAVLGRLAAIGGYFVLHAEVPDDGQRWRPVTDLLTDPDALDAAITCVAGRLGTTDRTIAASVFQQGWASRLTSIHAGSLTLGLPVPDLAARMLRYAQPATGPVGLAMVDTMTTAAATVLDVDTAWRGIVTDHLRPLHDALRSQVRLANRQLWGNATASFAGSLRALARAGNGDLRWLVRQPWANPPELHGLGRWTDTRDGPQFHRATCCGLERLSDRSPCAGCPFAPDGPSDSPFTTLTAGSSTPIGAGARDQDADVARTSA